MIADRIIAWSLALALALFPMLASAQSPQVRAAVLGYQPPASAVAFQGPGDVATYIVYYSLRAYSAAKRGNPVANICNSTGGVDVLCADATSDAVTGATVIPGSVSSFCPGAVCTVKTFYDQTVGLACTGGTTCNLTQATVATRPVLTASAIGTSPALQFTAASSMQMQSANNGPSGAQPYTMTAVARRLGATGTNTGLFATTVQTGFIWANAVNTVSIYAGGGAQLLATAADASAHAFQGVLNATSSSINVDGTLTNPATSIGTATLNGPLNIGNNTSGFASMYLTEIGIASGGQSGTVQNQVCHNQITYYGISGTC